MRKTLLISAILFLSFTLLQVFDFFPLVIGSDVEINNKEAVLNEKGRFNPFKELKFTKEDIAYLIFSNEDKKELPKTIKHHKVLYCDNVEILSKLSGFFYFKNEEGDMSTCESSFVVMRNGNKIFQSAIVIRSDFIGIQTESYGWSECIYSQNVIKIFSCFEKSKSLILRIK